MFYLYAVGSMIAYSLQNALVARFSRRMDGLSTAAYRGLSFVVTLTPLFVGGTMSDFSGVIEEWPWLLTAGVAGAIYLACAYAAQNSLPIGVAISMHKAFSTIAILLLGIVVFREILSHFALILIAIIIGGTIALGLQKNYHSHLQHHRARGIGLSALGALPYAVTITIFAFISKSQNPLITGYFWEVSIGIGALILVWIRWCMTGKGLERISRKEICLLALAASPTLIGTGLFGLAAQIGSVTVVSSIGNATLVVTALLAWALYREPLRFKQWISIGIVLAGIIGLKFV